ncbi:MAG: hypothetical protein ACRDJ9_32245, partial [Dehalococcoidia bacterium]
MAIAARDTGRKHLALQEGTPIVDLVTLLAIGVVERTREQRRAIMVQEGLAGIVSLGDLTSPRVTLRAGFDLAIADARPGPHGVAGRCTRRPA